LESALFAEERKKRVVELLREQNKVLVPDLCKLFNISPATVRNDLNELAVSGLIHRTHGGAIPAVQTAHKLTTVQKVVQHIDEKRAIAQYASTLVHDGDSIALDTGTTTMELVRCLVNVKNLTVLLNDIEIALFLENNSSAHVVLVGGRIRRGFHCMIGSPAVQEIKGYSVDKVFIAANAANSVNGLATPDISQAEVKKALISIALEKIALVDSGKIGRKSFAHFASMKDIDLLVTDSGADQDEIKAIQECGVDVVQVNI
jgi:DeoR family fructose operon transcriptional repressor